MPGTYSVKPTRGKDVRTTPVVVDLDDDPLRDLTLDVDTRLRIARVI